MLGKGTEVEVDVTWEDQKMINMFGRLTARRHELEAERRVKTEELTNIEDASNEIILLDDDQVGNVKFSIGEAYVDLSKADTEERLNGLEERIKADIARIEKDVAAIQLTLGELKIKLYAKFSNSINLEEE
eukprot:TRINITY_DN2034_c0_g1_i1.p1 TRINITY_DN2034_c0_g1~~TRINITY_DN2034_c0_g1_i1.p1  ORF type:complete len:131 (-),score=33.43 TRINITY_DN2034_c0_g1_i1:50-442(-)